MKKNNKFFEDLKKGLEEILAHKQGKLILKSEIIEIPEPSSSKIKPKLPAKSKNR
jgi:hypothetical protein